MGCGLSKQGNPSPASSKSSFSSDIDSVSSSDKRNGIKNRQKKLVKKRNRNQVHNQTRHRQSQDQSKNKMVPAKDQGHMHLPTIFVNPPTPIPPQRTEPRGNVMDQDHDEPLTDSTMTDDHGSAQTSTQPEVWLKAIGEHNVKMPTDQVPGVIAAEFLPDGSLVILDKKNNSVKHYSETFSFLSEYRLSSTVVGMSSSNDKVYVAVQDGIHVFDTKQSAKLEEIKVMDIPTHVHAIAASASTEQLLIVISTLKSRQIQHLDFNGDVIKSEDLKAQGETAISPEHVCVLDTGDILVANEFDSAVYVKRYDKSTYEATGIHFNHINGIIACEKGILVAGHDYVTQNVLRKYDCSSSTVRLLRSVKKDDIGFVPWGLAVRQDDMYLVTGGFQDIIKVHLLLN